MRALGTVLVIAGAVTCAGGATGCGKSTVDLQSPIAWQLEPESALSLAKAQKRPLLVFVGAEWDASTKEMQQTFADREVRSLVRRDFVPLRIDVTDDEAPRTREVVQRFDVVGTPTTIILDSDGQRELKRFHSFVAPKILVSALRGAERAR